MLKICPKCRKFYDDANLRFCLLDGVPLAAANENLLNEGAEKIRLEKQIERRKTFRVKTKNILTLLITTVLTITIFSVVIVNSWLYFNPEKEIETVKNEMPLPTPTVEISPTIEVEVSPTPETTPNAGETISPTPTATPITNTNTTIVNTNTTIVNTNTTIVNNDTPIDDTNSPNTNTNTQITDKNIFVNTSENNNTNVNTSEKNNTKKKTSRCPIAEIENSIISRFGGEWRERFFAESESVRQSAIKDLIRQCERHGTPDECRNMFQNSEIELGQKPLFLIVAVSDDCQTAAAIVTFEWKIYAPQNQSKKIRKIKRFVYRKQGNAWN